ncbi:MAG: hypothetical protein IKT55_00990 [Clostridia bacterium]|nr:hypothetical protein [Clostridia bacterium]
MTKFKKLAAILLLLLYILSATHMSVLAAIKTDSLTVDVEEKGGTVTEPESEILTGDENESETDESQQEPDETETETEFDESDYDFSDMAPDIGDYVDDEYSDTNVTIQYEDFDTFDEFDDNIDTPSYEPGYDFSGNILPFALNTTTRTTEDGIEITLDKTINGQDFKRMADDYQFEDFFNKRNWFKHTDEEGFPYFFTMQGSCFGYEYYFFAFTVNRKLTQAEKDSMLYGNDTYTQEGYLIIRVPENNLDNFFGDGTTITYFEGVDLYHLNDMTYNTITNEIIIAACTKADHDAIYTISSTDLVTSRKVSESDVDNVFVKHNVSCNVTSIAFSEKDGFYIVGLTNKVAKINGEIKITENNRHRFAKLDYDFNLIGTMGNTTVDIGLSEHWQRQTIFVDNNYIYNLLHLYDSKNPVTTLETENMIEIYDLSGQYKKTIYFKVPQGTDRRYEAENLNIVDGRLLIGFNCAKSTKTRDFCYYDLTEYGFSITYCPDDNIATHITDDDLTSSFVLRGFGTELFTNPFSVNGKVFKGWNAYRKEIDKWFSVHADKTTGWYKEGEQPEGYTKYRYDNKATVSQTGLPGEHVYMCAQWEDSNVFTVYFKPNSGSGTMTEQTITHGTTTSLKYNTFTKTNRTFKGWNAYWVEKKQWLYVDSFNNKKWCREGAQPVEYKKYVYSDGETVSKTVHKGNQVIMYAVWDEFFIYYNPNGKAAAAYELLPRKRGWTGGGNVNSISPFVTTGFDGYNLYWREADKWLYYNSATQGLEWFKKGAQTSGYSLYLKTFNNGTAKIGPTVPYGQTLVLYAKW